MATLADGELPFFLRQLPPLGNACGTIACIHAALNANAVKVCGRSDPIRPAGPFALL
jgi:hypothetical protein